MKVSFNLFLIGLLGILFSQSSIANFSSKTNGEFLTLSGKVTEVSADWFKLKTDNRVILVEMDDYDWDADGYKLVKGDRVVVSGRVDNDFLEKKKVEAGSVYVKGLDTYFYASSDDEEGAPYLTTTYTYLSSLPDNTLVDVQGKITDVDGRKFTVNTGFRKVTVDTEGLSYNPLDKVGYTKISKGDRVRVSGKVDNSFFTGKEVRADSLIRLY
jgi:uncharacterized protein YdeI (BOF family)